MFAVVKEREDVLRGEEKSNLASGLPTSLSELLARKAAADAKRRAEKSAKNPVAN